MGLMTKRVGWMVSSAAAATFTIGGLFIASGNAPARAADAAANPEGVKLFEAKIRPILAEHCVGCHGPEKQKGKLRLDTREKDVQILIADESGNIETRSLESDAGDSWYKTLQEKVGRPGAAPPAGQAGVSPALINEVGTRGGG